MKKKVVKRITLGLLLILLLIPVLILSYYFYIDIQTKPPKELKEGCQLTTQEFMGRNVFIISQQNKQSNTYILYFHGGAYVAEPTEKHWDFVEQIVNDTGATIILPDYPLTPKYTYQDVFKMVVPLYENIIKKIETNNLIVMGDSAGGGLALALEEKVGEQNLPMPTKTILISPWLDVRLNNPEIKKVEKNDKELNKISLKLAGMAYTRQNSSDYYLASPIEGDLSKLTNVTILTGTYDILNPDVKIIKKRAEKVGIAIEVKEYEQAGHIWLINQKGNQELIKQGYQEVLRLIKEGKSNESEKGK